MIQHYHILSKKIIGMLISYSLKVYLMELDTIIPGVQYKLYVL